MAAKLSTLPTELIELITSHLRNEDILSLRLVSQDLSQKAARSVNSNAFKTIRTDLSQISLEKLKHISEHQNFRHRVRTLEIKGASPPSYRSRLKYILRPSKASLRGSTTKLLNILQNGLVNCRSFRICYNYRLHERSQNTDAIAALFDIIAKSGLLIQSFEILGYFAEPTMFMGRLKGVHRDLPQFKQGWAHLQKLSLYPSKHPKPHSSGNIDPISGFSTLIKRLSDANTQPRLQELSLSGAFVREEDLSRLVLHYRNTLRAFSLVHISIIRGGTWASALGSWKNRLPVLERFSVWFITDSERKLIHFDNVGEIPGTGEQRFREDRVEVWEPWRMHTWHGFGVATVGVGYQGAHASQALEYLAMSI